MTIRFSVLAFICLALLTPQRVFGQDVVGTLSEEYGVQSKLILRDRTTGEFRQIVVPPSLRCKTGLKGQELIDLSLQPRGTVLHVKLEADGITAKEIQELYPVHVLPAQWLDERLSDLKELMAPGSLFNNKQMLLGFISVLLVSAICGAISSLVLSNRMAFFSDALAHFAFAGVALGILMHIAGWLSSEEMIVPVMVVFGILTGCGIAYVKQKTVLANDTIIGVFFAGAMGLGAILLKAVSSSGGGPGARNPENFLFGDPMATTSQHIVYLLILSLMTSLFLVSRYNKMVLSSFNTSLARSRRISVQWSNYLFIIFLAMTVNACLKVVGALLINALLILPAATAGNISRTLRMFFWLSLITSLVAGVGGFLLSATWKPIIGSQELPLASGGVIVLIGTFCFFLSMLTGPLLRGRRAVSATNA